MKEGKCLKYLTSIVVCLKLHNHKNPSHHHQLIERGADEPSIDFLQVDAVFMPVRKVSYTVEDSRHNNETMQDELTLEIWTNGSITPHEAISEGSEILTSLFSPFKEIDFKSKENEDKSSETTVNQILIEELQSKHM